MTVHSMQLMKFFVLLLLVLSHFPATHSAAATSLTTLPPRVHIILAKISPLMVKKDYPEAVRILTTFLEKYSLTTSKPYHHPELYFALGNCYLLQQQYPEAAETYRQVLAQDPKHTHAWLNLAKTNYEMKQFRQAALCFLKGYESEEKKQPETLYYGAAAYLMEGDYQHSIEVFARLLLHHSQAFKPEWKEHYVHALLGAGQAKRALPLISELVSLYTGEKQVQWQEILLYQYVRLNMHKEALNYAKNLTEQSPQVAKWWQALAHIQLNDNRYEEALTALIICGYRAALNLEETRLLADLFLQVGIPKNAVPVYTRYMQTEPAQDILYRLALSYYQLGKPVEALKVIDNFKQYADDYQLRMLQGHLCYRLQRYREAHASFRQAAAGSDEQHNGQAWLMAGYAAIQLDDFANGRDALLKAGRCAKEKKKAAVALQQLEQMSMANATSSLR